MSIAPWATNGRGSSKFETANPPRFDFQQNEQVALQDPVAHLIAVMRANAP